MSEHTHSPEHTHRHGSDNHDPSRPIDPAMWTAGFWDERYGATDAVWSGNPNRRLVEQVADLAPGRAVDVGCGEGADAVWLAQQGWQVTGVDVSPVALQKAAAHAAAAGVTVEWALVDLVAGEGLPATYDLVSAHFLHPPVELRGDVLRRLGAAVTVGGTLLYVGHHPQDLAARDQHAAMLPLMPTPEDVVAHLDPATWDVRVAEVQARRQLVEGREVTVHDSVVRAVRIS
ncbi:class I SAM-dependent methyltransferase [Nocardioides sp. Arc9.136]|uniref:class I SAM-dependent methyltransferase n=1 Tax=Nocardioides sp. Arc9.136 TaxID=2996826 RepID=UPI002666A0AE|nr:class I SAM-dependent methyltransferase [Nocardioides sp. Arc9.136]WKN49425.1 class I SAM-dependent methyltransferase [Nocardioides sp. Arc9.136]